MIPPLGSMHLPAGRYRVTPDDVHARFVAHEEFAGSETRAACWAGLVRYLTEWSTLEAKLAAPRAGRRLLMALWLGGSFVSRKLNPNNVDLALFIDAHVLADCNGHGYSNALGRLTSRDKMKTHYLVSPLLVRYRYCGNPWGPLLDPQQVEYLRLRGGHDDWWTRARPDADDKGPPTVETASWVRGYLEVIP